MKRVTVPTLSQHLRDEANKFLVYPDLMERTSRPLEARREAREWVNEVLEKIDTFNIYYEA